MARTIVNASQDDVRQRSMTLICKRAQEQVLTNVDGDVLHEVKENLTCNKDFLANLLISPYLLVILITLH